MNNEFGTRNEEKLDWLFEITPIIKSFVFLAFALLKMKANSFDFLGNIAVFLWF